MNNVTADNDTPDEMGAGNGSDLFPEGDAPAGVDMTGIAQQLASIQPDQLAQLAMQLDPDIRANLAQACYAAMGPDERAAVDTTPGGDVAQSMGGATPQRPEEQYAMSITRAQKQVATQPGMGTLADDHLGRWQDRIARLHESGYLNDAKRDALLKRFDKAGEFRFSIILDNKGHLHDDCVAIEALEEASAGMATLSKSLIQSRQSRFSTSRPVPVPADKDKMGEEGSRQAQEAAGSRLAKISY